MKIRGFDPSHDLFLLYFLQIPPQRIPPIRQRLKAYFHQLALIEPTVKRTRRLGQTIFSGRHKNNLRIHSSLIEDFLCKVFEAMGVKAEAEINFDEEEKVMNTYTCTKLDGLG